MQKAKPSSLITKTAHEEATPVASMVDERKETISPFSSPNNQTHRNPPSITRYVHTMLGTMSYDSRKDQNSICCLSLPRKPIPCSTRTPNVSNTIKSSLIFVQS